jgi:iron-sulfur cluster assembly protein
MGGGATRISKVNVSIARGIEITAVALEQIRTLLGQRRFAEGGLRAAIEGGGCAGLNFAFSVEEGPREHDRVLEVDGVRLFIDPKSFIYLYGMTLDYQQGVAGPVFVFLADGNGGNGCGCANTTLKQ